MEGKMQDLLKEENENFAGDFGKYRRNSYKSDDASWQGIAATGG